MFEIGVKGNMWRVVRSLCVNNRSCIILEGKSLDFFRTKPGLAQDCTLSPTLFLIYTNCLLCEIQKCLELGVKFTENTLSSLLFDDEFVRVGKTRLASPKLINIIHNYSKHWHFEPSVKSVLVFFFFKAGKFSGGWVWFGM